MRPLSLKKLIVSSMVIAAVAMTAAPVYAGGAPGAQVSLIGVDGSLTSGSSDLSYFLNLNVTAPGTLTAQAKIKGKSSVDGSKWKADFPDLMAMPLVGFSVVSSDVIPVPASFRGTATLIVKVRYDGKKIAKQKIAINIGAAPAAPALPLTTLYDVGFNTSTNLDASVFSTAGLTGPFTYAWSITDSDIRTNATLAGASTATPTLTTLPIGMFPINLDFIVDQEAETMRVGIDTDAMEQSTYHVRCIITDSLSSAVTGTVTVISGNVSPAQQAIPLGERQYFSRGVTTNGYSWSLIAKPPGSAAVLENSTTRNPSIVPDKEGAYTIVDNRSGEQFEVKGAKFVGVSNCAQCHGLNPKGVGLRDMLTPWSQTGHATFAQRGIDGLVSPYYRESCLPCHTIGNNPAPLAQNDGFDDVQWQVGWMFPNILQIGNFANMPAALQDKSNISCEACHGPGSQHPGPASTSLDVAVCATCHQDGHYHTRVEQWERSPHSEPFFLVSEEEEGRLSCAKCHSTYGFIDNSRGLDVTNSEASMLSCQGCHDPHNEKGYPHQVRYYDTVQIDPIDLSTGEPLILTGQGTSATCMACHNSRRGPYQDRNGAFYFLGSTPHGGNTATDVLLGLNACTNVLYVVDGVTNSLGTVTLENSAHTGVAKCVDCHMHENPGIGQPGHNLMGDHTFSVRNVDTGESNLGACQKCHAGVDDVADIDHISVISSGLTNGGDYDGDGVLEGVQSEVDGLIDNLLQKCFDTGLTMGSRGLTGFAGSSNPALNAAQRAANWNIAMIQNDRSIGIHNTAYTVRLLQWNYTVLSTTDGGNSYAVDFPNADLR